MNGTLDLTASRDPEWVEWLEVRAGAAATSGAAGRQKASAASAALASFEGGAARILAQWAKADPAAPPSPATAAGAESSAAASSTSFVPSGHLGTGQATAKMASAGLEGTLANAQDRAQRLADRLGEAVGQRMLTELEKGNWHLNLKLRPESLGSIEIEMRMHAGQLNAQFTAHQALTRDLLSDGINRLKDMLAQMGMNVAQMNVNGGRSQQRGGDSTPRQSQGVRAPEATSNNQETDAKNPSQRSALLSGSGWDMLV
jgi:flagellar hook-length control protein FliK